MVVHLRESVNLGTRFGNLALIVESCPLSISVKSDPAWHQFWQAVHPFFLGSDQLGQEFPNFCVPLRVKFNFNIILNCSTFSSEGLFPFLWEAGPGLSRSPRSKETFGFLFTLGKNHSGSSGVAAGVFFLRTAMTIPPTVRVMPRDQNMKRSILRCSSEALVHLLILVDLLKAPVHLSLKFFKTLIDLFETFSTCSSVCRSARNVFRSFQTGDPPAQNVYPFAG